MKKALKVTSRLHLIVSLEILHHEAFLVQLVRDCFKEVSELFLALVLIPCFHLSPTTASIHHGENMQNLVILDTSRIEFSKANKKIVEA